MDEEFYKIWKSLNNIAQDVQVFLWDLYVDTYPEIRLATVPEVALWLAVARQVYLPVAPPEKELLYDYGEGPDIYLAPGIDISTVPEGKHTCLIIDPQGPATAPLNIVEYDAGTAPAALFLQRLCSGLAGRRAVPTGRHRRRPYAGRQVPIHLTSPAHQKEGARSFYSLPIVAMCAAYTYDATTWSISPYCLASVALIQ